MSDAKQILEQAIDRWNVGDRDGWADLYTDDVVYEAPGGARIEGIADLKEKYFDAPLTAAPDRSSRDVILVGGRLRSRAGALHRHAHRHLAQPRRRRDPGDGKSVGLSIRGGLSRRKRQDQLDSPLLRPDRGFHTARADAWSCHGLDRMSSSPAPGVPENPRLLRYVVAGNAQRWLRVFLMDAEGSFIESRSVTRFALVVLTFVVLVAVPAALATSPGRNGRIVYMVKDGVGHWQIRVANEDLSSAKKLTNGRYDSGWAAWAPDGKRLVFDSNRTDHTPNDSTSHQRCFRDEAGGSGVRKLTDSQGVSGDAAWSPNGSLIAFDADRGNRKGLSAIYVMPANGGKLRRVTDPGSPLSDYKPRFSPDGTHLIFTRARGTADHAPAALFTVRLDGSGLHRLTSYALRVDDSDWSPDGKRIVVEAYPNPDAIRRYLCRRRDRRYPGQSHAESSRRSGLRRPRLVSGWRQDPVPRQPSRERRRQNRSRDDRPGRLRPSVHLRQEPRGTSGGLAVHPLTARSIAFRRLPPWFRSDARRRTPSGASIRAAALRGWPPYQQRSENLCPTPKT